MSSLMALRSVSNSKIKMTFDGGDLSSDADLLLLKEFICKIGLDSLSEQHFQTNDNTIRIHKDKENMLQKIYQQFHGTSYAIRLKVNATLLKFSESLEEELHELTKYNKVDYSVVYGEFRYAASSWGQTRRIIVKIEKPIGQLTFMHTYIVTNMDSKPSEIIRFYYNRGRMENFIKESKSGFDMDSMSSHSMTVNENRMQISVLVYNIFNWFRRLVLPVGMRKLQIDAIRLKLLKIAAKWYIQQEI